MRRLLIYAALAACLSTTGCKVRELSAEIAYRVSVMVLQPQNADSIGFSVTWQHPLLTPQHRPLAHYQIRIVEGSGVDTLAASTVQYPTTSDTLWMPMPTPGDTLVYYAAMASVDSAGVQSIEWELSAIKRLMIIALPPPPPEAVDVDTIPRDTIPPAWPMITHGIVLPDTANLNMYFGTADYEFLGISSSDTVACVRAQIFEEYTTAVIVDTILDRQYEIIDSYDIHITSMGVCENRGNLSQYFYSDEGHLLNNDYWINNTTWYINIDTADTLHFWRGNIVANILYPPDMDFDLQIQDLLVQVEDVDKEE